MERISGTSQGIENKIKKATSEMLALFLMSRRPMYANEIATELKRLSDGAFAIVFPYNIIHRMEERGHIRREEKQIAADGRLRQFYSITEEGKAYLHDLVDSYRKMEKGISQILNSREET